MRLLGFEGGFRDEPRGEESRPSDAGRPSRPSRRRVAGPLATAPAHAFGRIVGALRERMAKRHRHGVICRELMALPDAARDLDLRYGEIVRFVQTGRAARGRGYQP